MAFTQVVKMIVPLFARMRNQYCVFALRPVTVSVAVLAATFVVVRPCVNRELVACWIVNPVSLLELSAQVRITERILFLFGPFTTVKLFGGNGRPASHGGSIGER